MSPLFLGITYDAFDFLNNAFYHQRFDLYDIRVGKSDR